MSSPPHCPQCPQSRELSPAGTLARMLMCAGPMHRQLCAGPMQMRSHMHFPVLTVQSGSDDTVPMALGSGGKL